MEIKISNGNFDIISSGTIVANHAEPIEFTINGLTFIFEFLSDLEQKTPIVKKDVIDKKALKFTLINFDNSLGHRNTLPISLATIDGRKLFINYGIYSMSDTTGKIFHYTFLLEKGA